MRLPPYGISVLLGILLTGLMWGFRAEREPTPYPLSGMKFFPPLPETSNAPTVEGAKLGRFLFYDPILSADRTVSCASCHRQEVAFSDAPQRFSRGIHGDTLARNTMPLFNLGWYPALFWDGRATSIEEQVFHPVRDHKEMDLDWPLAVERIRASTFYQNRFRMAFGTETIDSTLIANAIAQFERTLISKDSKYDRALRGEAHLTREEYEGFVLMNDQSKGDCLHCHTTDSDALGTTARFSNNGLEAATGPQEYADQGKAAVTGKPEDVGRFRIPSLRNVAVTAPYMHDGRFETLEEVVDFYSEGVRNSYNVDPKMASAHRGGVRLTTAEKAHIVAFLHALTDSVFLSNPEFGNPFVGDD